MTTTPLRPGSVHAIPWSGPDPWTVRLVLRHTLPGGIVVPGTDEVLMSAELRPELVAELGGPEHLPNAFEAERRRFATAARAAGYTTGYAVELDITRGRRRRLFSGLALPPAGGLPRVV